MFDYIIIFCATLLAWSIAFRKGRTLLGLPFVGHLFKFGYFLTPTPVFGTFIFT